MKTFEDVVRGTYEKLPENPIKEQVLRLYVEKTEMDRFVDEDTARYRDALEATGGIFGGIEPVHRFHEKFQEALDISQQLRQRRFRTPGICICESDWRENSGLQGTRV